MASKWSIGKIGAEILLLQKKLTQQGFDILTDEVIRAVLGPSTFQAIQTLLKQHGLQISDLTDDALVEKLRAILGMSTATDASTSVTAATEVMPVAANATTPSNAIQIDATQLFYRQFLVPTKSDWLDARSVQTLQLEPGLYSIQFASGYYANFEFSVSANSTVSYADKYAGFVSGNGTSRLTLIGFEVILEASTLSGAGILFAQMPLTNDDWISQQRTLRLLPAENYTVQQGSGEVTNFVFKLGLDGQFSYAPAFDVAQGGFLAGNGTDSLSFIGFPIQVDATALGGLAISVWPILGMPFGSDGMQLVSLLPAQLFYFWTADGSTNDLVFAIDPYGAVTFDPSLSDRLQLQKRSGGLTVLKVFPRKQYVVTGRVTASGQPIAGINVTVGDLDVRGFQLLGGTQPNTTDTTGSYRVTYTAAEFSRAEKDRADLVFYLVDQKGSLIDNVSALDAAGKPLGTLDTSFMGDPSASLKPTPILANADISVTVNFELPPGVVTVVSEYEQLLQMLEPLLVNVAPPTIIQPTLLQKLADLKKQEIDFLTLATGVVRQKIEDLVTAVQVAHDAFGDDFSPAFFYGLAREGLPLDLPLLARKTQRERQEALDKSFNDNLIPASLRNEEANFLPILQTHLAKQALDAPLGEGRKTLSELLNTAQLPRDLQQTFFTAYTNHDGPIEDFWTTLATQPGFQQPGVTARLQCSLQLGLLTQNHLPLIQALQTNYQVTSVQDLVKLDKTSWTNLINQGGIGVPPGVSGATPEEQVKNYVDGIVGAVQVAFPTATIAQIVATTPGINIDDSTKSNVTRFFANAPDLELRATTVDEYLAKNSTTAFNGIAEADRPSVVSEVKRLQRVFQISTSADVIPALLTNNLDSAYAIANIPRSGFIATYADALGDPNKAEAIYNRAVHIHGRATFIYSHLRQSAFDVIPRAIGDAAAVQASIKQVPNYRELFGSIDFCECRDCRSVLSPAAYFVDLLEFLRKSLANGAGNSPFDVLVGKGESLWGRRPDLRYIKLSCENTNTLIPYVDLVNEVLESFIVYNSSLPNFPVPPNESSDGVTSAELAANAENTNEIAYQRLNAAVYPFTLPFNLPLTTVRVYLDFLGSSRHALMETFQRDVTPATLHAIDAEALRISAEEYGIFTGQSFDPAIPLPTPRQTYEFYGYDSSVATAKETVWVDDALPPGASTQGPWNWISTNPTPFSGTVAHQVTTPTSGGDVMQFPSPSLEYGPDDILFTMVYLDPVTTPTAVVLVWGNTKTSDTYEVGWFKNPPAVAEDPKKIINALPPTGRWVRLEIPMRAFGTTGNHQIDMMVFGVAEGKATWDYTGVRTQSWLDLLSQVPEFLQRTGIAYTDLIGLLKTRFINPNSIAPDAITLYSATSSCNLDTTYLQRPDGGIPDEVSFRHMHGFIRLWRKLGWAMIDVDRLLIGLKATEITPEVLHGVSVAAQLQTDLNLAVQVLASLWADLDRQGDDALYNKLFLSKAVRSIDAVFQPQPDGSVLPAGLLIKDHIHVLLAAFRTSEGDLALIRAFNQLDSENAALTLATVSMLYRYVALAKALKLKIADFISLRILAGSDPFATPDATRQFAAIANQVRDAGFKIGQLDYLYRHVSQPPTGLAPQATQIHQLSKTLRDGLAKIQTDNVIAEDPRGDISRAALATIFESDIVDQAVRMLDGTAIYIAPLAAMPAGIVFPDLVKNKISYDKGSLSLRYAGAMTSADLASITNLNQPDPLFNAAVQSLFDQPGTFIKNTLQGFLKPAEAEKLLLRDLASLDQNGQPVLLDSNDQPVVDSKLAVRTAIAKKFGYFLERLLPYVRDKLSHSLVKQALGDALKLDTATAAVLLEDLLKSQADKTQPAVLDVLALVTNGLDKSYFASTDLDASGATPTQTGIDTNIAFDGIKTKLPAGTNSIRWTGKLIFPGKDAVTFYVRANALIRLWVGDDVLPRIEQQSSGEQASVLIALKAGQLYDLRLELTQLSIASPVEFRWQSATLPKALVAETALMPKSVLDIFSTTYTRLSKAAMLINGFTLSADELQYLDTHASDFANFDLQALPLDRSNPVAVDQNAPGLFIGWQRIADYVALRDGLPQGQVRLIDLFNAAAVADNMIATLPSNTENDKRKQAALDIAKSKLLGATGWDQTTVDALTGAATFTLNLQPPVPSPDFGISIAAFRNEQSLVRLQACIDLIRRLGVSAPKLFTWSDIKADYAALADTARDVKKTVKAKFDDDTWPSVAKPLSDSLRESQKAALIAHILTLPAVQQAGVSTADQLYEYFLIDVQMSACMQTSRIKQAISSVQLFVQRCLINLENRDRSPLTVKPSQIDAETWEQWRKHYRVWEANRKVFLYPENWIEPELRDDKSPIFKELESELLQSDLSTDSAETAFLNYLEKLEPLAKLTIWGMYWQKEEKVDILHVFGRTGPGKPHLYYYRQLLDGKVWTAWEKVQIDIPSIENMQADKDFGVGAGVGTHLLPIVWNRNLYVFWPEFTLKTLASNTSIRSDGSLTKTDPEQQFEIRWAWSRYRRGNWSPKQLSTVTSISDLLDLDYYIFRTILDSNGQLVIVDIQRQWDGTETEYTYFSFGGPNENEIEIATVGYAYDDSYIEILHPRHTSAHFGTFVGYDDGLTPTFYGFNLDNSFAEFINSEHVAREDLAWASITTKPLTFAPSNYKITYPQQFHQYLLQTPFFYHDATSAYFVTPSFAHDEWWIFNAARLHFSAPINASQSAADGKLLMRTGATSDMPNRSMTEPVREVPVPRNGLRATAERPVQNQRDTFSTIEGAGSANAINWAAGAASSSYNWLGPFFLPTYHFKYFKHFHPYVAEFTKRLVLGGIPALLSTATQLLRETLLTNDQDYIFAQDYAPSVDVEHPYPVEDVEFGYSESYSLYNWELFFHIPLLIATRLSKNQRFDSAMKWFHYIFNPTNDNAGEPSPARYWNVLPFKNTPQKNIQDFFDQLNATKGDPNSEFNQQVNDWIHNPFNPHRIARQRLSAYQKNVFMKYLDNLIAWADQLFSQDTIESINEATQLYVLAADLLGPRPQKIPQRGKVVPETYAELTANGTLDAFGNALVTLENAFPFSSGVTVPESADQSGGLLGLGTTLFFCVPQNDKLLGYWDTVADRLFKIRHCMNLAGVVRQLPLFEPPIDPALLVQATAAGIDISSVLGDLNSTLPCYRFSYTLQKALELCAELKSLSSVLTSALEKKDAEELGAIRAGHETELLRLVKSVKEQQHAEALASADAISKSREMAIGRYNYYQSLLGEQPATPVFGEVIPTPPIVISLVQDDTTGGMKLTPLEKQDLLHSARANSLQGEAASAEFLGSMFQLYPELTVHTEPFGCGFSMGFGGRELGTAQAALASQYRSFANSASYQAGLASKLGGSQRRDFESLNQKNTAAREIMQIDKQIIAAKIRVDIAQKESDNAQVQIDNAQQVEDFLRTKFTNQDLYGWMSGEVSTVYFQAYQIAYDLAKKAEKAFRFERGLTQSNFIQFGYWDSLRKGMLAGERELCSKLVYDTQREGGVFLMLDQDHQPFT